MSYGANLRPLLFRKNGAMVLPQPLFLISFPDSHLKIYKYLFFYYQTLDFTRSACYKVKLNVLSMSAHMPTKSKD